MISLLVYYRVHETDPIPNHLLWNASRYIKISNLINQLHKIHTERKPKIASESDPARALTFQNPTGVSGRKPNDKPSQVIRVPTDWIADIKLGKLELLKTPKANLDLASTLELVEELEKRSFEVTLYNDFMPVWVTERRRRIASQKRTIKENDAIKALLETRVIHNEPIN